MMTERPIDENDLQAYVDGAIEPARRRMVEAYLAHEHASAERVARQIAERAALREALAPIAGEQMPARLDVARLVSRRSQRLPIAGRRSLQLVAAAVVLFGLGAASGYQLHAARQPAQAGVSALAREAADSFRVHAIDPERPVEIDAAGKAELVRWFSERLQSPVAVPDLLVAGYQFLGGRLVTTPHGPAALFVYADTGGGKLAVLVRPMAIEKNTRMSEHVHGALGSVAWADNGIGYGLVGAAAPGQLHPLADEVRRQIGRAQGG